MKGRGFLSGGRAENIRNSSRRKGRAQVLHRAAWIAEPLESRTLLAAVAPVGGEFLVNTTTAGTQANPHLAMNPTGTFVMVWEGPDSDGTGIYAQRYSASGVKQGNELKVNLTTTNNQISPRVAIDSIGNFVIVWQGKDSDSYGVYAQRYNSTGVKQGSEFRVNTTILGAQSNPSIAMDSSGNFAVAWESRNQDGYGSGIYARRYSAAGVSQSAEFRANTTVFGNQEAPALAMSPTGDFIIAWHGPAQGSSGSEIYAQRYNASGTAQGSEFRVNTTTTNLQLIAAAAMDSTGNFVIAWQSKDQDGSGYGIYAQRYDAVGISQGTEFQVNSFASNNQQTPRVAMNGAGDFIITWESRDQDGSGYGIYGQRYNSAGLAQSGELLANISTANSQRLPAIGLDSTGNFIFAWQSSSDIYAQRYGIYTPGTVIGRVWNDLNGNNIQDSGEPGIDGVKVDLLNAGNTVYGTTTTSGGGLYSFDNVYPGIAQNIQVTLSSGFIFVKQKSGSDITLDSDVNAVGKAAVTLTSGQIVDHIDAGFVVPASVSGRVWNDMNGNGLQDLNEPGIDGIGIAIFNSGGASPTNSIFTSGGGFYNFTDVLPGVPKFISFPLAAGAIFTQQNAGTDSTVDSDINSTGQTTFTLSPGQILSHLDAGMVFLASVAGQVFADTNGNGRTDIGEIPLAGWQVYIDLNLNESLDSNEPSMTTGFDGLFKFSDLYPGDYSIRQIPQSLWNAGSRIISVSYNQTWIDVNLANTTMVPITSVVPIGSEYLVNSTTKKDQQWPGIGMDAKGNFVVVWNSDGQDGDGQGIYAQRYNALARPVGPEFRVNTTIKGHQAGPAVAMNASGDFVVTWVDYSAAPAVRAQRFDPAGIPMGEEIQVNATSPTYAIYGPQIAIDGAGDFIVVWYDSNRSTTLAQRFNAVGTKLGAETPLTNGTATGVAMDAAGDFIVAWQETPPGVNGIDVYAQRYNLAGVPLGSTFRANAVTAGAQSGARVAMDATGDFVISWHNFTSSIGYYEVYARRFNAAGVPQGSDFRVSTVGSYTNNSPDIAMNARGDFVVIWQKFAPDGSFYEHVAKAYNAAGLPSGNEILVGTLTGNFGRELIAIDAEGGFAAAWHDIKQSGVGLDIYARRYSAVHPMQIDGNPGNDSIYLKSDAANISAWVNHNPATDPPDIIRAIAATPNMSIVLDGSDTLTLDFTGGNLPIPINIDGATGADILNFIGNIPGRAGVTAVSGNISITGGSITLLSDANGLAISAVNNANATFATSQHLASLSLSDNAKVTLAPNGNHFIKTTSLNIAGNAVLDLADNDLVLQSTAGNRATDLAALTSLIKAGRNAGSWNGPGIISSSAATEPNKLFGLAIALNDKGDGTQLYPSFDGESASINDVLVKFTYNGDADLNGAVDADDYFRIDSGFAGVKNGYDNGDFDLNGIIDADDYFLIDRAFVGQSTVLAPKPAAATQSRSNTGSKPRRAAHHRAANHRRG